MNACDTPDLATGERPEAVGEPGFRIGNAGEIDAGGPLAMSGAHWLVGHLHRGRGHLAIIEGSIKNYRFVWRLAAAQTALD